MPRILFNRSHADFELEALVDFVLLELRQLRAEVILLTFFAELGKLG
jgi:hypothetical protein